MSAPKEPIQGSFDHGTADGGARGRWISDEAAEAARLELAARELAERLDEIERANKARDELRRLRREIDEALDPVAARQRREIVEAWQAIDAEGQLKPTIENVAARIGLSESGLKRRRIDLRMTGWPPTLDPD